MFSHRQRPLGARRQRRGDVRAPAFTDVFFDLSLQGPRVRAYPFEQPPHHVVVHCRPQ